MFIQISQVQSSGKPLNSQESANIDLTTHKQILFMVILDWPNK